MIPRSPAAVGLAVILVIAVATYLGFTKDVPFFNPPFEVNAAFRDSSGLKPGSPVRVAGVDIGEVTKVEHTSPGSRSVTATMAIKDSGRPIHDDATARIRPRIFLEGNFYVDITPGTPQAGTLEADETIPASRTSNPVQVGEVLSMLTSDTRADVKQTLSGLAAAQEAGAGREFNQALDDQGEAYKYSAIVSQAILGRRPGDLARWIRNAGTVSAALDRSPEQLKSLVTDFNITAGALADREADLREAVRQLPGALREALPTFAALNDSFPSVRRFARASLPAVRSSGPAIDATIPLVRQLRGLMQEDELRGLSRDLRDATPDLVKLARRTIPVLEEARALGSCASNVLAPFGDMRVPDQAFEPEGPVHQEFGWSMPNLAGESRSFDANGQWFKVLGGGGVETLDLGDNTFGAALSPVVGVNPPPQRARPPLRPDVPCETQQLPNLETKPDRPPPAAPTEPESAKAVARSKKARAIAIAVMQARLKLEGKDWTVVDRDATPEELRQLAEQNGLTKQVDELAARARELGVGR